MNMIIRVFTIAAVSTLLGCGQAGRESADAEPAQKATMEDVKKETSEAVAAALQVADQTKSEFTRNARQKLEDLEGRLRDMREKAADLGTEARLAWDERMDELTQRREAVEDQLARVADAGEDAWREAADGLTDAWNVFVEEMKEAEIELEEESPAER